jgi:hypothetical protein
MSLLSDRRTLPTFVAGGVAGCTAAVLTCPLEVIKTKLQSRSLARSSFLHVVRSTWLTEGYKGFFKGLVPLLSGECPVVCPSCVAASRNHSFRRCSWASAVLFRLHLLQRKRRHFSRERPRHAHRCRRSRWHYLSNRAEPYIRRENQTSGSAPAPSATNRNS